MPVLEVKARRVGGALASVVFLFKELYPFCNAGAVDFFNKSFLLLRTNWLIVGIIILLSQTHISGCVILKCKFSSRCWGTLKIHLPIYLKSTEIGCQHLFSIFFEKCPFF